ncbi:DNA alkylation repair protein [Candidatus Wolfebacteria bacterium]|nr:DNA alkylation repair protein [Candidatus Wolfebacteria bacterium]
MKSNDVKKALRMAADEKKAVILARFFKTKKGEYGDGDIFIGVVVPQQRKIAAKFAELPLKEIEKLLKSKMHEERLTGLIILVNQYKSGNEILRDKIFKFYLKNISCVNNWDLVDLSCRDIIGEYLIFQPRESRKILYKLVKSKNIWERRIAIVSSWAFIRKKDFNDTLRLAEILINDNYDLIHKAVGWMLREVGKKDERVLRKFLDKNVLKMPRTMLRYAIERFPEKDRKKYLAM